IVLNRPWSVRPVFQTWVMSGPRTPRPSVPWQSAHRRRYPPMPAWIASGSPSKGFLPWVVCSPTAALAKVGADEAAHAITHETTTAANNRQVMAVILQAMRPSGHEAISLFFLGFIDVRGLAEEHFRRFHQRFRQRRVRMNRELQVRCCCPHLDR